MPQQNIISVFFERMVKSIFIIPQKCLTLLLFQFGNIANFVLRIYSKLPQYDAGCNLHNFATKIKLLLLCLGGIIQSCCFFFFLFLPTMGVEMVCCHNRDGEGSRFCFSGKSILVAHEVCVERNDYMTKIKIALKIGAWLTIIWGIL